MTTNEDIMKAVAEMRADICGHLHDLAARQDGTDKAIASIDSALGVVDRALTTLDEQVGGLVESKRSNSMRAKQLSDSDLGQAKALADEIVARRTVEAKVDQLVLATKEQSDFLGIGKRGLQWLASKEGRAAVAQIAIVIGVAYETLRKAGVIK